MSAKPMALLMRESGNWPTDFDELAPVGFWAGRAGPLGHPVESSMRAALDALRSLDADAWPTTFDGLRMLGVPGHVVEQLSALADASASEGEVVAAFLAALVEWNGGAGNAPVFARHVLRAILRLFGARASDPAMTAAVKRAFDAWLAAEGQTEPLQDAPMASG